MEWSKENNSWIVLEQPLDAETVFWPNDENGNQRVWKWGYERVVKTPSYLRIGVGADGVNQVFRRNYLNVEGSLPGTWWDKPKYAAGSHGTNLLTDLFGESHLFLFPKSIYAVEDCLLVGGAKEDILILDFFAGSGTTGHAVINLNRIDDGQRKYILVDVAEYFDSVLKPRIMKAVYSAEWKDGRPVGRQGVSHCFKYLRLESYEDCLNNLRVERSPELNAALEAGSPDFREEYLLGYLLDFETRDSLLSLADFRKPFDYQLRIANGSAGESVSRSIDLVETFNYLLGLRVRRIRGDNTLRTVEGTLPDGRRALVLWRDCDAIDDDALREKFTGDWLDADPAPDVIYVNGPNTLRALRPENAVWTVQSLEETFLRRMFDGEEASRP